MTDDLMWALQETYKHRKYAPLHWSARANNARVVAEFLWNGRDGADSIALYEGYQREAAVALELIIKAVIVALIDAKQASSQGLEETHDLPKLWRKAKLPALSREDQCRLAYFKSVLTWLGRYPTPRTAERWQKDIEERESVEPVKRLGDTPIVRRQVACGFGEFAALYQQALDSFHVLTLTAPSL